MTNIFIAFASQDRDVRDKLLRQMNLVKDREGWNIWASHEIKAGATWSEEIKTRLADSEIVVLLMSSHFFTSQYILEVELPAMIEKHRAGNCHIIPVLARSCHWKDTPFGDYAALGDIQALPARERPIVSKGAWDSDDEPYVETVAGIKQSVRAFRKKQDDAASSAREQAESLRLAEKNRIAQLQQEREAEQQHLEKKRLAIEKAPEEEAAQQATPVVEARKQQQIKRVLWGIGAILSGVVAVYCAVLVWGNPKIQSDGDNTRSIPPATEQVKKPDEPTPSTLTPTQTAESKPPATSENGKPAIPKMTTPKRDTSIVKRNVSAGRSGRYSVRLGSFSSMENARTQLEKAIKLGYPNASIVMTGGGKFPTVVAFRTNDKAEAVRIMDKLEEQGIDALVYDDN